MIMNLRRYIPFFIFSFFCRNSAKRLYRDVSRVNKAIGNVDSEWRKRIELVKTCPDNNYIDRDINAGEIDGNLITMHNGVKVTANGYYGAGMLNLLVENAGVHEPQEERAFGDVLEYLPVDSVMLELGSYWGFYSLSLLKKHERAICYLVEPDPKNFESGKINFKENGQWGHFSQALVGEKKYFGYASPNTVTVASFCAKNNITHLHVLHADIQGHEVSMLHGAMHMLHANQIDYLFISTHSNSLHEKCREIINSCSYQVLADADLDESYSTDGLIVAKSSKVRYPTELSISKRNQN